MEVYPIYGKPLWKKFIQVKYGESIGNLMVEGGRKDIMPLEEVVGLNRFNNNIIRKVANEYQTNFWKDIWAGEMPLFIWFSRLFFKLKSKGG